MNLPSKGRKAASLLIFMKFSTSGFRVTIFRTSFDNWVSFTLSMMLLVVSILMTSTLSPCCENEICTTRQQIAKLIQNTLRSTIFESRRLLCDAKKKNPVEPGLVYIYFDLLIQRLYRCYLAGHHTGKKIFDTCLQCDHRGWTATARSL